MMHFFKFGSSTIYEGSLPKVRMLIKHAWSFYVFLSKLVKSVGFAVSLVSLANDCSQYSIKSIKDSLKNY